MKDNELERIVAYAQIGLSVLFLTGFFVIVVLMQMGVAHIPTEQQQSFNSLITLLSAGSLSIIYFWFQRARGNASKSPPVPPENESEVLK